MDKLEEDLYKDIGFLLHETSWSNSYQINPFVALDSFFEAFKQHNFKVFLDDKHKFASFKLDYRGRDLNTSLTYEKILSGWKHQPFSPPNSLYDSICIVYDNLNPTSKEFNPEETERKNLWFYYRHSETKKVRQKMEDLWLPFFIEYQENMFLSVDGKIPELKKPEIFYNVLEKFPMHIYRIANRNDLFHPATEHNWVGGPTEETLLEFSSLDLAENLNPEEYYPSKFTMKEFFWGHYLNEFSNEKGYLLRHDSGNKLRSLMSNKESGLELGYLTSGNLIL